MAGQQITAAYPGTPSTVALLQATQGCFVSFPGMGPGPGTLQFSITPATSGATYAGAFQVWYSPDGVNLYQSPSSTIQPAAGGASGAPASGAYGSWTIQVPGSQIFVICTSLSSGSPVVSPSNGIALDVPGNSPSASTVTANQGAAGTSPWLVEDSAAETSLASILTGQTSGTQETKINGSGGLADTIAAGKIGLTTNPNYQTGNLSLAGVQSSSAALVDSVSGNGYIDMGPWQSGTFQTPAAFGTGVTSLPVQGSNDPSFSTWTALALTPINTPNVAVSSLVVGTIYDFSGSYRYIRLELGQSQSASTTTVYYTVKSAPSRVPYIQLPAGTSAIGGLAAITSGGCLTYCSVAGFAGGALTAIKAGAGSYYGTSPIYNSSATVGAWLNFYNAASITYGTTVPIMSIYIPALGYYPGDPRALPVNFSAEIYYTLSTSISTLTAPSNTFYGAVMYE